MSTSVTFKNPVTIYTIIDQFNLYFTNLCGQYTKLDKPVPELITDFLGEIHRFIHDPNHNQYRIDHEPGKDILTFYGSMGDNKFQWMEIKENKRTLDTYYILSKKGVDPIYIHTYIKDSNFQYEIISGDKDIPLYMVDVLKLFSDLLHGINDQEICRQTDPPVSRVYKTLYHDILLLTDKAYQLNLTHTDYLDELFDTYQKTIDHFKNQVGRIRYVGDKDDEGCLESIVMHDIDVYLKLGIKTPSFIVAYQNIHFIYTGNELQYRKSFIRGGEAALSKMVVDNEHLAFDIKSDKEEGETPVIMKVYIDSLTKAFPYIWTNII